MNAGTSLQDKSQTSQASAKQRWMQMIWLAGISLYLYVNLFALPNVPFLLEGDQTYFRANALRMLHGERIYQDFFQFTPPGTDIFYLALFRFFGPHIWVMNAAVLFVGVALSYVCFSLAKLLMKQEAALLAASLFLVLVYVNFLDATHHWFSLLAVMCAIRIVLPGITARRTAFAGALLGLASFFTQTTGVACAIALLLFLLWDGRSSGKPWRTIFGHQLLLTVAFGLTLGALSAHFIAETGWRQLWYFLVMYPQRYVAYGDHRFIPRIHRVSAWRNLLAPAEYLFIYILPIVIYPAVLVYCRRQRGKAFLRETAPLLLISLTGLSLLLEMITRVNPIRVYCISMPALILLIWAGTRAGRLRGYAAAAGWVILAFLAIQQTEARYRQHPQIAELPAGKTALSAERYEQFSWLTRHTKPGDLFFQSSWPNVYPPLDLRSPAFVDGLATNEVTRPEWVDLTIGQLEDKQVKYVLCSPWLYSQLDPSRPWEDHLGPFRAYLRGHYTRVQVFSDHDEIWERR